MDGDLHIERWQRICAIEALWPQVGAAARYRGEQIALFRVGEAVYCIGNYDPNSEAAVLSRGMVGSLGERIVVASPIYKQHFDLRTGECLEAPHHSVRAYAVKLEDGAVWVNNAIFAAGDCSGGEGSEDLVFRDLKRGVFKKLVLRGGVVKGAALYGDVKDGPWYFDLIQSGRDVGALRSRLLFGRAFCEMAA